MPEPIQRGIDPFKQEHKTLYWDAFLAGLMGGVGVSTAAVVTIAGRQPLSSAPLLMAAFVVLSSTLFIHHRTDTTHEAIRDSGLLPPEGAQAERKRLDTTARNGMRDGMTWGFALGFDTVRSGPSFLRGAWER